MVLCVFLWQLCEKSWRKPLALHNTSRLILALDIGCRKWDNAKKQLKNLYLPFVDGVIVDIARELFYNKKNYIVGKKVKSQNGYKRQLS